MTFETGVDSHRHPFARVAVIAAFGIGWVQNIADHAGLVAAMGAVTGYAIFHLLRETGMLGLQGLGRMAFLAECFRGFHQQIIIGGLMDIMTGKTLSLGIGRMFIFSPLGQIGMAGKTESGGSLFKEFVGI